MQKKRDRLAIYLLIFILSEEADPWPHWDSLLPSWAIEANIVPSNYASNHIFLLKI
jgi:hypothetical protein